MKINADDKLVVYIPEWVQPGKQITLHVQSVGKNRNRADEETGFEECVLMPEQKDVPGSPYGLILFKETK